MAEMSGRLPVGSVNAVRCIDCGFVSPEPPDDDIECCWKGPNWQRVLLIPRPDTTDSSGPG